MSLPDKRDFESCLAALYAEAKRAPALYLKERSLDKARRLKNMALAVQARGAAAQAGKMICLIEKDIADANPPIPKEDTGRGKKSVNSDLTLSKATLSTMRRAYSGLSAEGVAKLADDVIREGAVPTRAGFIIEQKIREKNQRIAAAKARKASPAARAKLKGFDLYAMSIARLKERLEPESVDFILTDPPYDTAGVHTFKELSHFAGKVLKPGGAMIAMSGHAFLPDILNNLCDCPDIKYHWLLHYYMDRGPTARSYGPKIFTSVKPLFMFVKGKWQGPWMNNLVKLSPRGAAPNEYHKWGQSPEGFRLIIEKGFAGPGDVVCDPFLGGGASGLAALQHGCKFIGSDISMECVKIARGRLFEAAEALEPKELAKAPGHGLSL